MTSILIVVIENGDSFIIAYCGKNSNSKAIKAGVILGNCNKLALPVTRCHFHVILRCYDEMTNQNVTIALSNSIAGGLKT